VRLAFLWFDFWQRATLQRLEVTAESLTEIERNFLETNERFGQNQVAAAFGQGSDLALEARYFPHGLVEDARLLGARGGGIRRQEDGIAELTTPLRCRLALGENGKRPAQPFQFRSLQIEALARALVFLLIAAELRQAGLLLEHRVGRHRLLARSFLGFGHGFERFVERAGVPFGSEQGVGLGGELAQHAMQRASRHGRAEEALHAPPPLQRPPRRMTVIGRAELVS
jgi:hypothetical protein